VRKPDQRQVTLVEEEALERAKASARLMSKLDMPP
jgi:hypothetical protein